MNEIDTKCWINTRREPLINAPRMAHGDIDARIVDGVLVFCTLHQLQPMLSIKKLNASTSWDSGHREN